MFSKADVRHGDGIMSVFHECYNRPLRCHVSSAAQYFISCSLVTTLSSNFEDVISSKLKEIPWTTSAFEGIYLKSSVTGLKIFGLFCVLEKCIFTVGTFAIHTKKSWYILWSLWCHFVKVTSTHAEEVSQ